MSSALVRKYAFLMMLCFFAVPAVASASTQTYATPGTYTFTVPAYSSLTVEVWGGGGGGGVTGQNWACGTQVSGGTGGTSRFGSVVAGGGQGGVVWPQDPYGTACAAAGGGIATGGDTNVNGNSAVLNTGGSAPYGGAGGAFDMCFVNSYTSYTCHNYVYGGGPPQSPGAGGGGGNDALAGGGGGGGSGAYASKTYSVGSLTPGSTVSVVVGGGGAGGYTSGYSCGMLCAGNYQYWADAGASGEVIVTWTPQTCATPPDIVAGGNGFSLFAGILNRWLNDFGYSYCISNSSGLNYFIPARTSAELQSFLNAVPRLNGVSETAP